MENNHNKIHHSFGFAFAGIAHAFKENRNIRIHAVVAALVLIASFILGLTKFEKIIIVLAVVLVIASEMINTAIEEMVDLITNEHKEEAKRAKDVAAGMVFVASIGALIIGIAIFAPYIIKLLE